MGLFKNLLGTVLDEFRIGRGNAANKYLYANVRDSNKPGLRWNNSSEVWEFSNNGVDWVEMGSGGGGGYSLTPIALGETTAESGYVSVGALGIVGSDLGAATVKFSVTAFVANSGLTGDVILYNLTDGSTVATLSFTELISTVKRSSALTLPSGEKVYEVRIRVTGGSAEEDVIACMWAGIELS